MQEAKSNRKKRERKKLNKTRHAWRNEAELNIVADDISVSGRLKEMDMKTT